MPADPRDDFGIFADSEHMFFNLSDPFSLIREQVENSLRAQVKETEVTAIRTIGEPKWLTIGRKVEDDPNKVIVGHFAVCFRSMIDVKSPDHEETLDATLTLLFRDIDQEGEESMRYSMDLFADAEKAYEDDVFKTRFLEFRTAGLDAN